MIKDIDYNSEEYKKGEADMAKAVLRRIEKGKSKEHIKILCKLVIDDCKYFK